MDINKLNIILDKSIKDNKITVCFLFGNSALYFHAEEWMDGLAAIFNKNGFECIGIITDFNINISLINIKHVFHIPYDVISCLEKIDIFISLDFEGIQFPNSSFAIGFPHAGLVNYAQSRLDAISIQNKLDAICIPANTTESNNIQESWNGVIPFYKRTRKSNFYFIKTNYHKKSIFLLNIKNPKELNVNSIIYAPRPIRYSPTTSLEYRKKNDIILIETILNFLPEYNFVFRIIKDEVQESLNLEITKYFSKNVRFIVDYSEKYLTLFPRSLTLLSDTSSIVRTFSDSICRPAIQFHPWGKKSSQTEFGFITINIEDTIDRILTIKKNIDTYNQKLEKIIDDEKKSDFSLEKFVEDIKEYKTSKNTKYWITIPRDNNSRLFTESDYVKNIFRQHSNLYKFHYSSVICSFFPDNKLFLYLSIHFLKKISEYDIKEKVKILSIILQLKSNKFYSSKITSEEIITYYYKKKKSIPLLEELITNIEDNPFVYDESIDIKNFITLDSRSLYQLSKEEHSHFRYCVSNYYVQKSEIENAIKILNEGYEQDKSNITMWNKLITLIRKKGDLDRAEKMIWDRLKFKEEGYPYYQYSCVCGERNEFEAAIACARKAITIQPEIILFYDNLITHYKRKGYFEEIISFLQKNMEEKFHQDWFYIQFAYVYIALNDLDKAIEYTYKAIEAKSDVSSYHNTLVDLLRRKKLPEKALQIAKNFLEDNPYQGWAYAQCAQIYFSQDKIDQAITNAKRATELQPTSLFFHHLLIEYLFKKGDIENIEKQIQILKEISPNQAKTYFYFSLLYDLKQNFDEALYYAQKAFELQKDPNYFELYLAHLLRNNSSYPIEIDNINIENSNSLFKKFDYEEFISNKSYTLFFKNSSYFGNYLMLKHGIYNFRYNNHIILPISVFYENGCLYKKDQYIKFLSSGERTTLYGPYIKLKKGSYTINIKYSLMAKDEKNISSFCDAVYNIGKKFLAKSTFSPGKDNVLNLSFFIEEDIENFEIRPQISDECAFTIEEISINYNYPQ